MRKTGFRFSMIGILMMIFLITFFGCITSKVEASIEKSTKKENNSRYTIVIDAGHQKKGNSKKEPIGPGSKIMKAKVTAGTKGISTGIAEYVVNLQVAKKLEVILKDKGYTVIMIRDKHNVNLSNAERAEIANEANADVFIRLHCNGTDNSKVNGALTICQTKKNPYCGDLYKKSNALSQAVIDELCNTTGAKNRGIMETDNMSGINWCQVPVTIVEMGFMSNAKEDKLLTKDSYQDKLAAGMAKGIEKYLKQ